MRLKHVQFKTTVSFGGQLQSASINPVGDRPGQSGCEIDLDEKTQTISIAKVMNGKHTIRHVPMSNVAAYEILEVPATPKGK